MGFCNCCSAIFVAAGVLQLLFYNWCFAIVVATDDLHVLLQLLNCVIDVFAFVVATVVLQLLSQLMF